MSAYDELIPQFKEITQATDDIARTFLQQADGNIETAVQNFFASNTIDEDEAPAIADDDDIPDEAMDPAPSSNDPSATAGQSGAAAGPRTLSGAPAPPAPANWGSGAARSQGPASRGIPVNSGSRITSFKDLMNSSAPSGGRGGHAGHGHGDDDDDDDDDDEPERLYAGGERSGLAVENPDSGPNRADLVKRLLKQAAEGSRQRADAGIMEEDAPPPAARAWQGSGNRLGSAEDPEPDSDAAQAMPGQLPGIIADAARGPNVDTETPVRRMLTFWSDGYSIEDGPLMSYTDPQHRATLAALQSGRAPLSLMNVAPGQRVDVVVADRRREAYVPPPAKPFSGGGNRLGSIVPGVTESASTPQPPAASSSASSSSSAAPPQINPTFEIDNTKPTTRLQIVLVDGSRFPVTVNQDHTLGDIRRMLDAGNRGNAGRPYTLWSRMPKKLLDESQTVKEAGVLNSVLVQTLS